ERAVGVEIVARTVGAVIFRRRIARAPIGHIGDGIIGARDVERAAAGLPGVVLVLPGFMARFAGSRNGIKPPQLVAGLGVERDQPVAYAPVAAGSPDDDPVFQRQGRRIERHVGLVVEILVPDDLPGFLVGRDDAPIAAGDRNDEVVPQSSTAIA